MWRRREDDLEDVRRIDTKPSKEIQGRHRLSLWYLLLFFSFSQRLDCRVLKLFRFPSRNSNYPDSTLLCG